MKTTISYGKEEVSLYRTYGRPLTGLTSIPESNFTGRDNVLFAASVGVEVFGENFLPAYTVGDNALVVATDTMKNFILKHGVLYEGSTLEGFLHFVGTRFLEIYTHMRSLSMTGYETPFTAATVPAGNGTFVKSGVLFSREHSDSGFSMIHLTREGDALTVTGHRSGRLGFELIKITGSSFAKFPRDDYTTLPEVVDRPLFIHLDLDWGYADVRDLLDPGHGKYVASEQIGDLCRTVFNEFNSKSIQHLIHEMGQRILARFPQIASVGFDAQNRLWDNAFVSDSEANIKSYTDPRPPYGHITLEMTR